MRSTLSKISHSVARVKTYNFRTYRRCALFDLHKNWMMVEDVETVLKGANNFLIQTHSFSYTGCTENFARPSGPKVTTYFDIEYLRNDMKRAKVTIERQ